MKRLLSYLFAILLVGLLGLSEALAVAPNVQARYVTVSNATSTAANLSWINGNGKGRIVVISYGGTADWTDFETTYLTPLDAGDFSTLTDANGNFTTAAAPENVYTVGPINYRVIDILTAAGRTSTFINLGNGVGYEVHVYEYNIVGTNADFFMNEGTMNPRSFATTAVTLLPPSALLDDSPSATYCDVSWTAAAGATGYYLDVRLANGAILTTYDFLDIGNPVPPTFTIYGLTVGTNYEWRLRSYNAASISAATTWQAFTTSADATAPTITSKIKFLVNGTDVSTRVGTNNNINKSDATKTLRV